VRKPGVDSSTVSERGVRERMRKEEARESPWVSQVKEEEPSWARAQGGQEEEEEPSEPPSDPPPSGPPPGEGGVDVGTAETGPWKVERERESTSSRR
jgi:hypothetical protein